MPVFGGVVKVPDSASASLAGSAPSVAVASLRTNYTGDGGGSGGFALPVFITTTVGVKDDPISSEVTFGSGDFRIRRLDTVGPATVTGSWQMTADVFKNFVTWYEQTLSVGTEAFLVTVVNYGPGVVTRAALFLEPYQATTDDGLNYTVSTKLQIADSHDLIVPGGGVGPAVPTASTTQLPYRVYFLDTFTGDEPLLVVAPPTPAYRFPDARGVSVVGRTPGSVVSYIMQPATASASASGAAPTTSPTLTFWPGVGALQITQIAPTFAIGLQGVVYGPASATDTSLALFDGVTGKLIKESTLTAKMDSALGSTRGSILYRGSTAWVPLTPGSAGQALLTAGAGADPYYGTVVLTISGLDADPYFSYVSLLLHMEGTNGGTTFVDSSAYAHTVTVTGGPTTSTTQVKFGTAALKNPNPGGGQLQVATATELVMGTSDFTAEGWVYLNTAVDTGVFFGQENSTSTAGRWFLCSGHIDATKLALYFNGSSVAASATGALVTGAWMHVAYSRSGTSGKGFVNGALAFSYTDSNDYSAAIPFRVAGSGSGALTTDGYMDEVRITKGYARYTAAFTPPTSATTGSTYASPLTTKGDLFTRSASVDSRLAVGTDGFSLLADSTQTLGIKWGLPYAFFTESATSSATTRSMTGAQAIASAIRTAVGDAQARHAILFKETTDATLTALTSNAGVAANTNQFKLATGPSVIKISGHVTAINRAGSTVSAWEISGVCKQISGTVTLVGTPVITLVAQDTGTSAWAVSIVADDTNKCLAVKVTGVAATTIDWVAHCYVVEAA